MTELSGPGRRNGPLISQTVITDGDWHRIGLVWDGLTRWLYVDGAVAAQGKQTGGLWDAEAGLNIGASQGLESGTYWSGLVDDIRIYDRAVTP